jgi:tetrachlorobenzoquinone reductase
MYDLSAVLADISPTADVYCCGPSPMLEAFKKATAERPREKVHIEYFAPKGTPALGGFVVVLARSGKSIVVPPRSTILDALLDAGVDVPYSCREGVCGTCEVGVLEGAPDHRDVVLTSEERSANRKMMICVSGSSTSRLVLDL